MKAKYKSKEWIAAILIGCKNVNGMQSVKSMQMRCGKETPILMGKINDMLTIRPLADQKLMMYMMLSKLMDNSTLKHIERAISITADIDDFIENIFDEDDTIVDGMPNERHNNQPHHRISRRVVLPTMINGLDRS
ncbi:21649_t:CDS:2 [Rhizophagus irregularis]|nr:21649_t:CDS:2 [Rhizophagus irregularis]